MMSLWAVWASCRQDSQSAAPIEGAAVSLHPAISTVLRVVWQQQVASDSVRVSWVHEGLEYSSPVRTILRGPAEEVLLGLPANAAVEDITIVVDTARFPLGDAVTGPLPLELSEPELVVMNAASMRPEPYLLTSVDVGPKPFFGPCYAVILDALGRIVWYRRTQGQRLTWQPSVSAHGGGLLIDESTTYAFGDTDPPLVRRMTLDLTQQQTLELEGMSFSYSELPDRSFVYDERVSESEYYLTRFTPAQPGAEEHSERLWRCVPWMAPYSTAPRACATNTVLWSAERETVLWSSFETGILAEIDLETGALSRAYGPHPDAQPVIPASSALDRPHFPNWTEEGTLIVSTHGESDTQWAREFVADEASGSLREISSVHSPIYAEYGGQVQRRPSGHLLWQLGTAGVIEELTADGEVIWQVQWPGHLVGNATALTDLYALLTFKE